MKEAWTDNARRTSNEEAVEMDKDTVKETETLTIGTEKAIQAAALSLRSACANTSDDDINLGFAATENDPRLIQGSTNDSRNPSDTGNNSLSAMYSAPISSTLEDSDALPMHLLNDSSTFDNDSEDAILGGTGLDIKLTTNFFRTTRGVDFGNSSMPGAPDSPSWEDTRDSEEDLVVNSSAPGTQLQEQDICWTLLTPHQHGQEREMRDELRGTWSTQEEWDSLFQSSKDSLFESSKGSANQVLEKDTPATKEGIEPAVTVTADVTNGALQNTFALEKTRSSDERSDEVYTPERDYFPIQQRDQRDEQCADSAPVESRDFSKHVRVTVVGPDTPKERFGQVYQFVMASSISKKGQTPTRRRRRQRSKASSTQPDLQASISSSEGTQSSVSSAANFLNMLISPCSVDQDEDPGKKMSSKDHGMTSNVDTCDGGAVSQWQRKGEGNISGENKRQNADRELPVCHFMQRIISDTFFGNNINNKATTDVVSDEKYRSHELVRTGKKIRMPPSVIEHENSYDDDASDITDVVWNVPSDETSAKNGYNERERQHHLQMKANNQNYHSYNEVLVVKKALESEELSHISNNNDSIVDKAVEEIFRSEESGTSSDEDSFDVTTIHLLVSQNEERDDSLARSPTFDYQASDDDDDDVHGDFAEAPRLNQIASLVHQEVTTFPDEVMDEVTGRLVSSAIAQEKGFDDVLTSARMMNAEQVTQKSTSADVYRLASSDLDTEGDRETEMNVNQDSKAGAPSISTESGEWVAFFDHTASAGKEHQIRIPVLDDTIVSSSLDSEHQSDGSVHVVYQYDGVMVKSQSPINGRSKKDQKRKPRVAWLLKKLRGGASQ